VSELVSDHGWCAVLGLLVCSFAAWMGYVLGGRDEARSQVLELERLRHQITRPRP
jgi:hypothetical protein